MVKKGYLVAIVTLIIVLVGIVIIVKKPTTAQKYFETGLNSYKSIDIPSEEYRKMSPEEKEECNKLLISSTDSAVKSYQEIVDKYPRSKWADDAQFCIAVGYWTNAYAQSSISNVDYVDKAIEANQKFITDYPEAQLEPQTRENLLFVIPKTLSTSPHAIAQWNIADIYDNIKKDYPQALIEYNKVIDNYPQDKWAHVAILNIDRRCSKLNDYIPAIEACQKLLKTRTNITPKEVVIYYRIIAKSYKELGDLKKAEETYQTIIDRFPNTKAAQIAQEKIEELKSQA
jgi:outer membrane protein assembly factor BamD (BamD/ComL family)